MNVKIWTLNFFVIYLIPNGKKWGLMLYDGKINITEPFRMVLLDTLAH